MLGDELLRFAKWLGGGVFALVIVLSAMAVSRVNNIATALLQIMNYTRQPLSSGLPP